MQDKAKTKAQLLSELAELRRRNAELEQVQSQLRQTKEDAKRPAFFPELNASPVLEAEDTTPAALHRLYSILSSMHAAVMLVADDGSIEHANQAFCDDFGLTETPEQLQGLTATEILEKIRPAYANPEEAIARINQTVAEGKLVRGEEVAMTGERTCLRYFVPIQVEGRPHGRVWYHVDITERKQAEEELHQSERRLAAVMENLPVGIWVVDATGKVTAKNKAADLIWKGNAPLSSRPEDYVEYIAWDVETGKLEADDYPLARTLRTGLPVNPVELRIRRFDGTEGFIMMSTAPLRGIDGFITGAVGINVDITGRRRAEDALRRSEERYRNLHETLRDPLVQVDMDGRILDFNDAYVQMLGYSPEEIRTLTYQELTPEKWHAAEEVIVREQIISRGYSDVYQKEYRRKDGTIFPVELRTILVRDADGRPASMWGVARDITERKEAEEALRESEKRYRMLFNSIDEGFCIIEVIFDENQKPIDYRFLETNASFERQTGLIEAVGKRMRELAPKHEEHWFEIYGKIALTGEPLRFENRADQLGRWYDVYAFRYGEPESHQVGILFRDIKPQKRTEEALRESEERLRLAHKATSDIVWDWDIVNGIQRWNEAGAAVLGWTDIGKDPQAAAWWAEKVHPEDRQRVKEKFFAVLNDPQADYWSDEYRFLKADGSYAEVMDRGYVLRDIQGEAVRMIGAVLDITSRKEMEKALKKSIDRLAIVSDTTGQLLMSEMPQQVIQSLCERVMAHLDCHAFLNYLVDEERNCLRLNAYAGISEETAREIHFLDFGVGVCGCAAREATRIVAENIPTTPDIRTDFVSSFGITACAYHPLFAEGKVIGTLFFGTRSRLTFSEDDLSLMTTVADQVATAMERMRLLRSAQERGAELEAQVSERTAELKHRAELLDLAHDAIIVTDMEGRITFWNRGAEEMYGWTADEVEGPPIYDLLKTRSLLSFDDLKHILLDKDVWEGELEHTTKDGRTLTVLSRWALQRDEAGNPIGIMRINLDITAAKQAEEQLRQAHKMEAIGTLAGGIAHDFNNILAAIIGFTEMAIEDVPDRPLVERNLQNVMTSATRARDLVKQILAFSRKTSYKRIPIALSPIIKETVNLLRASIPATIDMKFSVTATSDTVIATSVEVQQVLMNLATNALLSMEDRKGSLEIALSDTDFEPDAFALDQASREYIQIMVKDTGTGMTPEVMQRIFEPFFTTREVGTGSGMGLATVYGIVKDLGGTITVESEPGRGSTFRVFLPKVKVKEKEKEKEKQAVSPRGKERILFIDDEPLLVEWGTEALEKLGYTVTGVADGRQALEVFLADPSRFDLVITDQAMPHMPGSDLCAELLRIRSDVPIILCTGHSEMVSPETAKEMGISQFLMKPLRRHDLASAVRRVLDGDLE